MEKFVNEDINDHMNDHLVTYRIDRYSAIKHLKDKNYIEGFYSTCKNGFLEEYAHTKLGIVLMEIHRNANVPYLDFERLFHSAYAKPQEAEILLPFGAQIVEIEEVELSEEEKIRYTDIDGNVPEGKYRIVISNKEDITMDDMDPDELYGYITSNETFDHAIECIYKLMKQEALSDEEFSFYTEWKENVQLYINQKISLKHKELNTFKSVK